MADIHHIAEATGDEYEEITSEEVDRVIAGLEALMSQTRSENIRAYLEEAADQIFDLVYGEDAEVVADELPLEEAA
jgi:N-dimethylarginine dimethylaminohydrolase